MCSGNLLASGQRKHELFKVAALLTASKLASLSGNQKVNVYSLVKETDFSLRSSFLNMQQVPEAA